MNNTEVSMDCNMLITWGAEQPVSSYYGVFAVLETHSATSTVLQVLQYALEVLCL